LHQCTKNPPQLTAAQYLSAANRVQRAKQKQHKSTMAIHQTEEQVMTDSTDLPIIMTTTSANNPTTDDNLQEILQQIIHLYKNDQILSAARLLRSIGSQYHDAIHRNDTIFRQLLQEAIIFQQLLDQSNDHHTNHTTCTRPKEDEWIKQGERHGRYNFSIFYKISKENHLTCRIETPIGADLLVPLLSVLVRSHRVHYCVACCLYHCLTTYFIAE
jgi:hypothetical protein